MKTWEVVTDGGRLITVNASKLTVDHGCLVFTNSKNVPSGRTGPCEPRTVRHTVVTKAFAKGVWNSVAEQR